jgi:hypothetical protein
VGKRHRRIRARSATGQVAGAATEKPGLQLAHRPKRPAQPAFSQKAPRPSRPNLSPPPDTTGALKEQFHAPNRSSRPNPEHARRLASAFDDRSTRRLALDAELVCRCGRTCRVSLGPSRDTRNNPCRRCLRSRATIAESTTVSPSATRRSASTSTAISDTRSLIRYPTPRTPSSTMRAAYSGSTRGEYGWVRALRPMCRAVGRPKPPRGIPLRHGRGAPLSVPATR